jgi:hypothetical protein
VAAPGQGPLDGRCWTGLLQRPLHRRPVVHHALRIGSRHGCRWVRATVVQKTSGAKAQAEADWLQYVHFAGPINFAMATKVHTAIDMGCPL